MTAKTLDTILGDVETLAALVAGIGPLIPGGLPIAAGAAIAYKFLPVIQAMVKAHESATGKQFTIEMLHEIPLITDDEIKAAKVPNVPLVPKETL